jgi:hypothetical protein
METSSSGAQTERRGDAGPVKQRLAAETSPAGLPSAESLGLLASGREPDPLI